MSTAREARFAAVDDILKNSCGVSFTGAVARIERCGKLVFERAYGATRNDELGVPIHVDSRFDIASLTKLFIAALALRAVEEGRAGLDEPLVRWIPEWSNAAQEPITLRMLLAHTSGMHSGADYRELRNHNVVRYALERPLLARPGDRVIYSDLGFIALGEVLERMTGSSLQTLMRALRGNFRPIARDARRVAATECDGWRGRVQGTVHDEKAHLMGGIAGHAGIFATAGDVAWLAEQFLAPGHGRRSVVSASLASEAIREQAYDPVLRRGLGWALKTTDENSCGRYFSASSFGHTGFVGTCVWADPERDCQGVLLTNSVYFGRADTRGLRAMFYEEMIAALGDA